VVCAVTLMLIPALAAAQLPVAKPAPPPAGPTAKPGPQVAPPVAPAAAPAAPDSEQAPTEQYLNAPIYPGAEYLGSYDAGGRGQRFYLFGTTQTFGAIVAYYQSVLKQKGELVFDGPLVHMFDVGRFKDEDVAFPPGVTVKSYAGGGSPGYLNPKPGAAQASYPTIIQIVPPPAAIAGKPKR
jgi:hypothetical protein